MVRIPKGPFLYGDQPIRETIDRDYWIDIYPVTNEKYRAFILADGYGNQAWWTNEGWKWKIGNNINTPTDWSSKSTKLDHPVLGLRYYEAEAYANFVGKRLPSEQEWEKAARGTDGRTYPWGDTFDKNKCNCRESGIMGTTPVTQYPNGVSPYGCYDMVGNVPEWCASWYDRKFWERAIYSEKWLPDKKETYRVHRGGDFSSDTKRLRTSYRDYAELVPSSFALIRGMEGFRCAKDAKK